eukprot:tig00001376_g8538.t1
MKSRASADSDEYDSESENWGGGANRTALRKRKRSCEHPKRAASRLSKLAKKAEEEKKKRHAARLWNRAARYYLEARDYTLAASTWILGCDALVAESEVRRRGYTKAWGWFRLAFDALEQAYASEKSVFQEKLHAMASATAFLFSWSTDVRHWKDSEMSTNLFQGKSRETVLQLLDAQLEKLITKREKLVKHHPIRGSTNGEEEDAKQRKKFAELNLKVDRAALLHNRACKAERALPREDDGALALAEQAVELASQAAEEAERAKLHDVHSRALFQLGNSLLLARRYEEAAHAFKRDKEISHLTTDRDNNKQVADEKKKIAESAHDLRQGWKSAKKLWGRGERSAEDVFEAGLQFGLFLIEDLEDHAEARSVLNECVKIAEESSELNDSPEHAQAVGALALSMYRDGLCSGKEAWDAANFAGLARAIAERNDDWSKFGIATHTYADCLETAMQKGGLPKSRKFDYREYIQLMEEAAHKAHKKGARLLRDGDRQGAIEMFAGEIRTRNNVLYGMEKRHASKAEQEAVKKQIRDLADQYDELDDGGVDAEEEEEAEEEITEDEQERRLADLGAPPREPEAPQGLFHAAVAAAGRLAQASSSSSLGRPQGPPPAQPPPSAPGPRGRGRLQRTARGDDDEDGAESDEDEALLTAARWDAASGAATSSPSGGAGGASSSSSPTGTGTGSASLGARSSAAAPSPAPTQPTHARADQRRPESVVPARPSTNTAVHAVHPAAGGGASALRAGTVGISGGLATAISVPFPPPKSATHWHQHAAPPPPPPTARPAPLAPAATRGPTAGPTGLEKAMARFSNSTSAPAPSASGSRPSNTPRIETFFRAPPRAPASVPPPPPAPAPAPAPARAPCPPGAAASSSSSAAGAGGAVAPAGEDGVDEEDKCKICFELLVDPHMCPGCSQNICSGCWASVKQKANPTCPFCRKQGQGALVSNRDLARLIEKAYPAAYKARVEKLQARGSQGSLPAMPDFMCRKHAGGPQCILRYITANPSASMHPNHTYVQCRPCKSAGVKFHENFLCITCLQHGKGEVPKNYLLIT